MRIMRALFILMFAIATVLPIAARQKDSQVRTVHGGVLDKQDNIVNGGVVYLQNKKTQVIRTYISDDQGQYTFSGLDPNVDFETHAQVVVAVKKNAARALRQIVHHVTIRMRAF